MARIRTIKPQFWDDLRVGRLSRDARLLYIGMWNFADDCGVLVGDLLWLKSRVFPYDQIQMQQFDKWIEELVKTGFICLFSYRQEEFIYLPTFTRHQKIDKPNYKDLNVPKNLLDKLIGQIVEQSQSIRGTIAEQSPPIEDRDKDIYIITIPNGIEGKTSLPATSQAEGCDEETGIEEVDIKEVVKMYHSICVDYPKLVKLTNTRRIKIKLRWQEMSELAQTDERFADGYSVLRVILAKMQASKFMKGDNKQGWKADFDWILENDKNWPKILEGKYDNTVIPKSGENRSQLEKSMEFQQKMGVTTESIVF